MHKVDACLILPECWPYAIARWRNRLLVVILVVLAVTLFAASLGVLTQNVLGCGLVALVLCGLVILFPHDYVFDEEGVWTEPRTLLRFRSNRQLITRKEAIRSWHSTEWNGIPAVSIQLSNGESILLCYSKQERGTLDESNVFDWLNAAIDK